MQTPCSVIVLRTIVVAFFLAVCVFFHSAPLVFAQTRSTPTVRFGVVDARHGLPNNIVYHILQDRQGFMWFATMDGLARWDGAIMRVWRHNPEDSTGLASSDIRRLCEDSDGMLWIGTQADGAHRFNPRTETFTRFRHIPGDPTSLDGNQATEIWEDKAHRFWILANGTLHLFDRSTGKVLQKYRSREAAANPTQQDFTPLGKPLSNTLENALHNAWLNEKGELLILGKLLPTKQNMAIVQQWGKLNIETGKITPLFSDSLLNNGSFSGTPVQVNDSMLLVGSQVCGMAAYNTRTRRVVRQYLPDRTNPHAPATRACINAWKDRAGQFWINSIGGGLMQYHPETDDFTNYLHDPNIPTSLPFNSTMWVYEDRSGIVWVATPAGVAFYDPKAEKFTPYTAEFPDVEKGFHPAGKSLRASTRLIFSIAPTLADPNALWICATSEAGLTRFDTRTEAITRFRNTAKHPQTLPNNNIYHTTERPDGKVWLGIRHGGVALFEPRRGKTVKQYLPEHAIMPLLEDTTTMRGARLLWVGALGSGLYRINPATGEMKNHIYNTANPRSFIGRAVFETARDGHGRLWFGSMEGLSLYHPETDDFTNFVHDPAKPRSISCSYVECVVEDSKGRVWIGTEDGLNLFNETTHDFTRFGKKDGLPSAVVLGILEDKRGNLWLSTNQGLSCFHPEKKIFRNYDESDGLHGNTFNSHAYCRTADGRFWFGGVGGFSAFHPDSLRDNDVPPPVILTEFRKFNKPVRLDSAMSFKAVLTLDYTENFITIGFVALNFTHPEKNRYKYKLEGFDGDWIDAGTRREASYTNLDGGEYVFRVIACNNDGVWNTEGARLLITITPPFWKTRWFVVLALLTVVGGTAGTTALLSRNRLRAQRERYRLEAAQKQAEYEQQSERTRIQVEAQAHERERIFRDIHDGLGAQIVEIAAMSEQLKSEVATGLADNATNGLQTSWAASISVSVQDLRTSLREIVWLLNMENDTLDALVAYLRQETRRVLELSQIQVAFDIADTSPSIAVDPDVRRNIVMAVREACGNIIKHAAASGVRVESRYTAQMLVIAIHDNGRGFDKAEMKRFSNGLKTMEKRMTACGGTAEVESVLGGGTVVRFSVPLG
ncbi:MAG: two-component regulator propeller domain-containing protein [Candidatus Kapaibacteriota bacterium]